jgi:hypothetical protein
MKQLTLTLLVALSSLLTCRSVVGDTSAQLKDLSVTGGLDGGKARLVIEALLNGFSADKRTLIYTTTLQHSITASAERLDHSFAATLDIIQGDPDELPLRLNGEGEIRQVTGLALLDWSVRQETNGTRVLVLRPRKSDQALKELAVTIVAEQRLASNNLPGNVIPLTLTPDRPTLFDGFIKVDASPEIEVQPGAVSGVVPIETRFLPDSLVSGVNPEAPQPLAFRFHGSSYSIPLELRIADPESRAVVLHDFNLVGQVNEQTAAFVLSATARVKNPKGGSLPLLSGRVALTDSEPPTHGQINFEQGRFVLSFDEAGEFPVRLKFDAAVVQNEGWNALQFRIAPSTLQPIVLQGLPPDTRFQFLGAARPERNGEEFRSFLPPDGSVNLSWKKAAVTTEGKLFFAVEMLSQIGVAPGLMRQTALLDFKVMQGDLNRVALLLQGTGEVTRVQGDHVLSWSLEPSGPQDRRLVVQLNQAQKDHFALQVQMQTPLGAFPQTADAIRLRPEGATRFVGYYRIVNEGAVRLEIGQTRGLTQISPEQFPETDASKLLLRVPGNQRFAFRFSGADFALRIQADQILSEVTTSQVLGYHLGESELAIDAEIELEVREAPLRELDLRVPKGYAAARLTAPGLSDYFLRESPDQPDADLRLIFGQPISGRQVIQARLERNQPLVTTNWALPRVEVAGAKSTRGHVSVSADPGYRLTPDRTEGLTEIATAFFPRKVPGLQTAFRISDGKWQASLRVERLPAMVQADAFHLFSVAEGIAYGSSVLNYVISGAPVSTFPVELSNEYFNVEFTGKDIRNWQKSTNGYVVQLHTPVSGAYTLLATYERPFKPQGETLGFSGARPLGAQPEQGHTVVISAYEFQVQPVEVSPGLLPIEAGELPPEYRLLFDAPVLAAYRYTSRPFTLRLALSPLVQGESLAQVVDRATLQTRISKAGQVLTDARYFVKNRGHPNFRLTLPEGTQLWSVTVNGAPVVPVTEGSANLIPLPQRADPNGVLTVDLKLASRSANANRVSIAAPQIAAPTMLAEWKLEPDTGQRLVYRDGTLRPARGEQDVSGFAGLVELLHGSQAQQCITLLVTALILLALALIIWRWTDREAPFHSRARARIGVVLGGVAFVLSLAALTNLSILAGEHQTVLPPDLVLVAPVQQPNNPLHIDVLNIAQHSPGFWLGFLWPLLVALAFWTYGAISRRNWFQSGGWVLGWVLIAWGALRLPSGATAFLIVLMLFLTVHVLIPVVNRLWQVPVQAQATPGPGGAPAAAVVSIVLLCFYSAAQPAARAAETTPDAAKSVMSEKAQASVVARKSPIPTFVRQQIRVEDNYALATARIHWQARRGDLLSALNDPAVLTQATFPSPALKLVENSLGGKLARQLLAQEDGTFDIDLAYQLRITRKSDEAGFILPTPPALVNEVSVNLLNLDVDVLSPDAVSVQRENGTTNSLAHLVLSPRNDVWIGWRPRSRDVKREKAVFYAELHQLYAPTAGVFDGACSAAIRPAQGEITELLFSIPAGATITDVSEPVVPAAEDSKSPQAVVTPLVSLWRFDPDARKLRVGLRTAQSRPFMLVIRSQLPTGPLPAEQTVGLLSVEGAAGQIGLLGIATGNEVQLDSVLADGFSPINLEDFPPSALAPLTGQTSSLTLRRAYRYPNSGVQAVLKVSAVEPDLRIESQQTLSLGDDRIVLAANLSTTVTRAGIFRLSFALPAGLDVESISGPALSHWTELKSDATRVITLHLQGKTEGQQPFAITLTGPGVKTARSWTVPQLSIREASKQIGTLLIVPEQGMRLQVQAREGLTQLDPEKSGVRQKGVLAFRLLPAPWRLEVDIEQVDPWVQVTSLQHATVNEALVRVAANLQYQIENAGLKSLRVSLPTNAENVHFQGEQVADFQAVNGVATNGLQAWEIKLHRRVIGQYLLQASYQTPMPEQATDTTLRGLLAEGVNLQRGFVTIQSGGRLQLRADAPPLALQPTEWQSIPRTLQHDLQTASANLTYRLVEPAFALPLKLDRHPAAKLLPARVNSITLTSVISDDGVMLTQVRLDMVPGDKRLLHVRLPSDAHFWFAFVNQNGVWPWREQDQILIPLEQQSRGTQVVPVEIFYTSQVGGPNLNALDLDLIGPKFDLPLENLTWRVHLNDKWEVKHWAGSLQLEEQQTATSSLAGIDVQSYLQNEANQQREKTREAEQMLAVGNAALERGEQQQARRAFQAAFGLSQGNDAFNEDARVQLNNLKVQQAVVGLNVRQAAVTGGAEGLAGNLRDLRNRKEVNYTQQDAKAMLERNSSEQNAAFNRLAERIVQQQEAAVSNPAVLRATIPQQGRVLTFKRAVLVDTWADLQIRLAAKAAHAAGSAKRLAIVLITCIAMAAAALASRSIGRPSSTLSA